MLHLFQATNLQTLCKKAMKAVAVIYLSVVAKMKPEHDTNFISAFLVKYLPLHLLLQIGVSPEIILQVVFNFFKINKIK